MRENADHNNSEYVHFSHGEELYLFLPCFFGNLVVNRNYFVKTKVPFNMVYRTVLEIHQKKILFQNFASLNALWIRIDEQKD